MWPAAAPGPLRIDGQLVPLRTEPMTPVDTKQLCYSILTEEQKLDFEKQTEPAGPVWVALATNERPDRFTIAGGVAILIAMVVEAVKQGKEEEMTDARAEKARE
mgnify:CR=1 FL=1